MVATNTRKQRKSDEEFELNKRLPPLTWNKPGDADIAMHEKHGIRNGSGGTVGARKTTERSSVPIRTQQEIICFAHRQKAGLFNSRSGTSPTILSRQ